MRGLRTRDGQGETSILRPAARPTENTTVPSFRPVIAGASIFGFFGEGAFENGDPTDNHHTDTPGQASEEHDLENVFAPKHQVERHGSEPSAQPDWILTAGSL